MKYSKMIHGDVDIDAAWDEMIDEMAKMGIDDLTKIKQDAYNRYMAR